MIPELEQFQNLLKEELKNLGLNKEPKSLYQPIEYIISLGGKRLRPMLTLLACGLYDDPEKAMPQALAVEVFHNFSLMHDDIMDNAPLRRGQQTVHEKWDINTAILSGDAALVKSYELLAQCDARLLPELLALFNKTAVEVCEGQQLDVEFELRDNVSEDEYIQMIQLKTSVLLGCALRMGAIVGRAPKTDAEHLYQFGLLLGTAFQIKDDVLDCFGESAKVGKQVGGDIISNKKTLLLIHALNTATGDTLNQLNDWLGRTEFDAEEKVRSVKSIYLELGTEAFANQRMADYYAEAISHLDLLSAKNKKPLYNFAEWLFKRDN